MIAKVSNCLALCPSVFWILAPVRVFSRPLLNIRRPRLVWRRVKERPDLAEWFPRPSTVPHQLQRWQIATA